jgi:hypothetical protein
VPAFFSDPVHVQVHEWPLLSDDAGAMRRPICLPSAQMSFQPAPAIQLNSRKTWCGGASAGSAPAKYPSGHFATIRVAPQVKKLFSELQRDKSPAPVPAN